MLPFCGLGRLLSPLHRQGIWAALNTRSPLPFSAEFIPKELLDSGSRNGGDKHTSMVRNQNREEGRVFPSHPSRPIKHQVMCVLPPLFSFISLHSTASSWPQPLSSLTAITETTAWCSSCLSGLCPSQPFSTENSIKSLCFRGFPYCPWQTPPVMVPGHQRIPSSPSELFSPYSVSLSAFVSTLDYKFLEGMDRVFSSSFSHYPSRYPTHGKYSANGMFSKQTETL